MKFAKRDESKITDKTTYSVAEYFDIDDPNIDLCVADFRGRAPTEGWAVNTECKELLYIISGVGKVVTEIGEKEFAAGDGLLIDRGEKYYFDGKFQAAIICTPKWTVKQHEEAK